MAAIELESTPLRDDASLVSYYRLENSLNDELGTNNLTNSNSTNTASGYFNQGRAFASASSQFAYDGTSSGMPSGNGAFTMHCWMRFASYAAARVCLMFGQDGGSATGCGIYVDTAAKIRFEGASGSFTCNDATARSINTWYMVTATYNGAGQAKLYVNASNVQTTNSLTLNITANQQIGLGAWMISSSAGSSFFDGIVDDVAFFSRALTPTEITNLYNGTWSTGIPGSLMTMGVGT